MTLGGPGGLPPRLCIDASLALRLVLPDERALAIDELWSTWARQGVEVVGPALLYAEATSVIRLRVVTGRLTADEGEAVCGAFNGLGIRRIDRDDLHVRAWELAQRYNQRRVYDMMYLAVAGLEDLELWTSDERLVNAVGAHEARLRWVPATLRPGQE